MSGTKIHKRKKWEEMLGEVRELHDTLGTAIDEGIVETVVVLRLLGFQTTSSCEGHIGRLGSGPSVRFESKKAKQKFIEARKLDGGTANPLYKGLRDEAISLTLKETEKAINLLESFYNGRYTPFRHRLIVKFLPPTYNTIQSQSAEVLFLDSPDKKRSLEVNRAEMRAFTEYLKGIYFS